MHIKKLIVLFLFIIFFLSPASANAQVIFSDNFNDGSASDWIVPRNSCTTSWAVSSDKYGIATNGCLTESIPSSLSIGDNIDYSFEVDMTMSSSLNDRNFVFKYKDGGNWYGIHTYGNSIYLQKVVNGSEYHLTDWHGYYDFNVNETYHFKIESDYNSSYKVLINNVLILTVPDQAPFFDNYSAGLQASGYSQVWFDNVVITQIVSDTSTPSPTPTASPSPTPSPTPTPTATAIPTATPVIPVMSVTNLKQYTGGWENELYDHTAKTIKQWGCALTSAVMVLQYHGHNIVPDVLNTWLNDQTDGYIGYGLINWLAVSRYTKLNDSPTSPTLEFLKIYPSEENLDVELNNNRPAILKEDGHFIVATGKLINTYTINDPGYSSRDTLLSYSNSFLGINSYRPTHSDLSYFMFTAPSGITMELIDSLGNIIPTSNYIEDPINDIDAPFESSGQSLSVLLLDKPLTGTYKLKVTGGAGSYDLTSYLYNVDGEVTKQIFTETLVEGNTDIYEVTFTKEVVEMPSNSVEIDKTSPTITGTPLPSPISPTSETSITWSWTIATDSSGIKEYKWRIPSFGDGTVVTNSVVTNLTEGMWNFFVKAVDNAGNIGDETEGEVTIDTTPPTGNWIAPVDGVSVSGVVVLNFSATDNLSGVDEVWYSYKRNDGIDSFHTTSSNWDTTTLPLDVYTLKATITDLAGNNSEFEQTVNVVAVLSNQSSTTPSTDSAVISWITDKETKSRVVYDTVPHNVLGTAPNYGYAYTTETINNSPKVTQHWVTITGLSADTVYYYRTISEGSPVKVGDELQFRTLSVAGPPNPSNSTNNSVPLYTTPSIFTRYVVFNQEQEVVDLENEPTTENEEVLGEKIELKEDNEINWNIKYVILTTLGVFLTLILLKLLFDKSKKNK